MADPWAAYGPIATRSDASLMPKRLGFSEDRRKPTLRDRTVDFLTSNFYGEEGRDKAERVANVLDWTPPYMAYNTGRSIAEAVQGGNYRDAGMEVAMSALPAPAKKGIKTGVRAVEEKLGRIATGEPAKIRAFHGSPHDFDRFDLGRIGTGEGAQAYGHGLYFAENEATARAYRDALSPMPPSGDPVRTIAEKLKRNGSDIEAGLRRVFPDLSDEQVAAAAKSARDFNPGHMYEVEINADPAQFLDWDKPLSQQGDVGRRAISAIPDPSGVLGDYDSIYKRALDAGMTPADAADYAKSQAYEATGAHVMGALGRDNPRTTELLREQGIPGIKYLDQGSRDPVKMKELADDLAQYREAAKHWEATGNTEKLKIANGQIAALEKRLSRTRNYVVFDDKLINIVKKYGIAGALAAGTISQMQAEQLQQQGYN